MIEIPLKDGCLWTPHESMIGVWESSYPYIDVRKELEEIVAWNTANPKKRKTIRGITRHCNIWLSTQNQKAKIRREKLRVRYEAESQWGRSAFGRG